MRPVITSFCATKFYFVKQSSLFVHLHYYSIDFTVKVVRSKRITNEMNYSLYRKLFSAKFIP